MHPGYDLSATDPVASAAGSSAADGRPSSAPTEPVATVLRRLGGSGMWSIVAYACTAGSTFAVSIILARSFETSTFGRYSYHLWLLRTLPMLLALGVPAAVSKLSAELLGAGDRAAAAGVLRLARRLHRNLLVGVGIVATVVAVSRPSAAALAAIVFAGIAVSLYLLDCEAILTALGRFRDLSVFALGIGITQVVATAVGVALGLAWEALLLLFVLAAAIGLGVLSAVARRSMRDFPPAEIDPATRASFLRFTWVATFAVVINSLLWGRPELFFLDLFRTDAEIGLYSAALRLASIAAVLPLVAARPLLPEFSRLRGARHDAELQRLFPRICGLLLTVAVPMAVVGAALAGPLVRAVYGHGFAGATTVTAVLLLGSVVGAATAPATAALLTGDRPRFVVELGIASVAANLVLAVVLIRSFGIVGAALATIVAQALWSAGALWYLDRRLSLRYPLVHAARAAAAAAPAAGVAAYLAELVTGIPGIVAGGAAALVVYGALSLATGAARRDDIAVYLRRGPRAAEAVVGPA